jgi:hypothetical protein
MQMIRPRIKGFETSELTWAKSWPYATHVATHVNPHENTDSLVVRYRLSWRERLAALLGQDLFIWFYPMKQAPQWPTPVFETPVLKRTVVQSSSGFYSLNYVQPTINFFDRQPEMMARGYEVKNPLPDGSMSTKVEPTLEEALRRTVAEKLEEQRG